MSKEEEFGEGIAIKTGYSIPRTLIDRVGYDPGKDPEEWLHIKSSVRKMGFDIINKIYIHEDKSLVQYKDKSIMMCISAHNIGADAAADATKNIQLEFATVSSVTLKSNQEIKDHEIDPENTISDGKKVLHCALVDLEDVKQAFNGNDRKKRQLLEGIVNAPNGNVIAVITIHPRKVRVSDCFKGADPEMKGMFVSCEFMDLSIMNDYVAIGDIFNPNKVLCLTVDMIMMILSNFKQTNNTNEKIWCCGADRELVDDIQMKALHAMHVNEQVKEIAVFPSKQVILGEITTLCNALFGPNYILGTYAKDAVMMESNLNSDKPSNDLNDDDLDESIKQMEEFLKL